MNLSAAGVAANNAEDPKHRPTPELSGSPPKALLPWLFDTGSLTERMRSHCGVDFRLDFLGRRYARPLAPEVHTLELPPRRYALIRQVLLCCGQAPWVFARSVMPFPTLRGANRRIARLGKRPLGDVLFSNADLRRCAISISPLQRGSPMHDMCVRALARDPGRAWLRQSLFRIHTKPLLISEVFLSEIGF